MSSEESLSEQTAIFPGERVDAVRYREYALLALILFLALLLRLYRLDEQSVYGDDSTFVYLRSDSLMEMIRGTMNHTPENVPINYIIQYLWGSIFGVTPWTIRLFSVILNMGLLASTYLLGRRLISAKAALFTVFLLAVSPTQIFYAQSITVYPLTCLVASFSLLAFIKAVSSNRTSWWPVNFAANVLIYWIHTASLFILVAQGLTMLAWRLRLRTVFVWSAAHLLALLPTVWWLSRLPADAPGFYDFFHPATLKSLLYDLIADDVICLGREYETIALGITPLVSFVYQKIHNDICFSAGWALAAVNLCIIAVVLRSAIRHFRTSISAGTKSRESTLFLLAVVLGPLSALAVFSHVWRPYFQPRYTLYALPGFYLCVTWAVFRIRSLKLRSLVAALYAFLLISQTMLFLPATTRTNWIAATREISTQASPNDVAIAVLNPFYEIFFENAPDFPIPLLDSSANEAGVLRTLPDVIEAYFAQCDENTLIETSAWCVVLRSYLNDPWQELEAALSGKGFQYTSQLFSGGEHLLLYRVRPGTSVRPTDSPRRGPGPLERAISAADDPELFISTLRNQIRKHNYLMGSLTPFFLHPQPHDQLRQTCARLERAGILPYSGIRLWNKDTPVTNTGIHGLLKDNGSPITCRLIFRFALTQSLWENRIQTERDLTDLFTKQTIPRADSSGVESHLEMAALWQELGKDEEALAILSTALQDDSKNPRLLLGQAGCLFALGRVAEGNRIIDDVTQNNPLAAMMIDQIRASCGRSIRTLDDGTGGTESFPTGTVAKPSFCETANRKPL